MNPNENELSCYSLSAIQRHTKGSSFHFDNLEFHSSRKDTWNWL